MDTLHKAILGFLKDDGQDGENGYYMSSIGAHFYLNEKDLINVLHDMKLIGLIESYIDIGDVTAKYKAIVKV